MDHVSINPSMARGEMIMGEVVAHRHSEITDKYKCDLGQNLHQGLPNIFCEWSGSKYPRL